MVCALDVPRLDLSRARAVIFDLDDTLVNWREAEHGAIGDLVKAHLAPLGLQEPRVREAYARVMEENFLAFKATGQWWYVGDRLALLAQRLGIQESVSAETLVETFTRKVRVRLALHPGALEVLAAARRDRKTALLTNGPARVQRPKVEQFGLQGKVDHVGISGEIGHWKPDPRAFQSVCGALGVAAEEAVMVGDNLDFDILPAKAIGMQTVWVAPPGSRHPDADLVVPAVGDILGHFQ